MSSRVRLVLVGGVLLAAVALGGSGCILSLLSTRVEVTTLESELRESFGAAGARATVAACADPGGTSSDTAVHCAYTFGDPEEGGISLASTSILMHHDGLFGAIIDPVILQLPIDVTSVSGTFAPTAGGVAPRPLVVTSVDSFFAQPGTRVVPEAGQKFVIVDFPADVFATLPTTGTAFDFTFQFQRTLPPGAATSLTVKGMLAGKLEVGGQTFYPPMLPCVTDFAQVPALTIPANGNVASLLPQLAGLVRQHASLACNNLVYDFSSDTELGVGPAHLWLGLKNSDDQGTQFDVRVRVLLGDTLVAEGTTLCVTGITRAPERAREVVVPLDLAGNGSVGAGGAVRVEVSTRIGTTPTGAKCAGPGGSHANARGLRVYYDAATRASRLGVQLPAEALADVFLDSDGDSCRNQPSPTTTALFLDDDVPTEAQPKCRDSRALTFAKGNAWQVLGTWSKPAP